MISPVTGQGNKGLMRAEIKGGVREVIACKDSEGKIGLRLRNVNNVSINYLPNEKLFHTLYIDPKEG
jgi:hypothetical protein